MKRKNCFKLVVGCWLLVVCLFVFTSQVSADTNTVNFLYDAGGQRIYKGVNGGEHTYYVSPGIEVEISPQGSVTYRKNYYFSGKLVAVKDNSGGSEQVNYIHQDHLGSTSLVTSNTGQVVSQQVYYPYGSTRTLSGTLPTERVYTDQISDTDLTGLYYYNARYYNPQIAKFTQADPINDSLNKYDYVSNNPVNYIDPTGSQSEEDDSDFPVYNPLGLTLEEMEQMDVNEIKAFSRSSSGINFLSISTLPYVAQRTPYSCGSAVIAMYLATINENLNVNTLYPYVFTEINQQRYTLPWYVDNYGPGGNIRVETQVGPHYFNVFVEEFGNYEVRHGGNFPGKLYGENSIDQLLSKYGSLIVDADLGYSPIKRGYANHWIIIDDIVEVENEFYLSIRDPYRSKNEEAYRNPLEYMKVSGSSILVPWDKFQKTIGGYWKAISLKPTPLPRKRFDVLGKPVPF